MNIQLADMQSCRSMHVTVLPPSHFGLMIHIYGVVDCVFSSSLGGGLRRALRNARNLNAFGFQSHVLTLETDVTEDFQKTWATEVIKVDVPSQASLTHAKKRELLLQTALQKVLEKSPTHRMLATGGTNASQRNFLTLKKARQLKIPAFFDTSIFPDPAPVALVDRWKLWMIEHLFLRAHSQIFCQTHAVARHYRQRLRIPSSKLSVSPNGVDCKRFHPASAEEKSAARNRWNIPDGSPLIVTVGNVIPRKGTDFLIRAWKTIAHKHPDTHFIIAGTLGQRPTFASYKVDLNEYESKVMGLVKELPKPENVHLIGHLDEIEELYRAADLFVFASEQEGSPNVILEAMAAGLPCVMSPYPGFPEADEEFGRQGVHYVQGQRSPEEYGSAINILLNQPEKRHGMGLSAREWMLKTQDLSILTQQMAEKLRYLAAQF